MDPVALLPFAGTYAEQVGSALVTSSCTASLSLSYGSHSGLPQHYHDWCFRDSAQGERSILMHMLDTHQALHALCIRTHALSVCTGRDHASNDSSMGLNPVTMHVRRMLTHTLPFSATCLML